MKEELEQHQVSSVGPLEEDTSLNEDVVFEREFHNKVHLWGRITLWMVIAATIIAPLYLSFVYGFHPGWTPIIAGVIGVTAAFGVFWVLEPVTYFPLLGVSGTYMAFLVGNISNMCLPCSAAAQTSIDAKPGSKKAELAATLGISAAAIVHIIVLIPIIFAGYYLVSILPEGMKTAFDFILPATFGAIFAQFSMKVPIYGAIALTLGIILHTLTPIGYYGILITVIGTTFIAYYLDKWKHLRKV
ncbi:small-conductance mechanosensitive channel [Alteribacillus sp. YIM 98480]|uniref:small-conductance mechanosensitive channel n=1 Tax=Alteribacillus sp. YIM 98480 TaxID=2606599 RepID=UPI001E6266EB|nr:small-conductance mechanosensitive channel [Alteribacillus sp. YIM 98480]